MKAFRSDINALRAFSVAAVVLYHFKVPPFSGGFIGVDIFFVISGFLMTQIIVNSGTGLSDYLAFFKARITRIFPALAAMVLITVIASCFLLDPVQRERLLTEAPYAISFSSNIYYALHLGYFDIQAQWSWFLHTWSLSVEWQFYLVYPIALMVLVRFLHFRPVTVVILGFFLSLALTLLASFVRPTLIFYLLPFRAWEMAAGGLAYFCSLRQSRLRTGLGLVSALALTLSVIAIAPSWNWPSYLTLIPVCAAAVLLICAFEVNRSRVYTLIHHLGIWSYSIYLWHWIVLQYLRYDFAEDTPGRKVLGIGLSVLFGALSYYVVERPAQGWLRRLSIRNTVSLASAVLATAVVGFVGLHEAVATFPLFGREQAMNWRPYLAAHNDGPTSDQCSGLGKGGSLKSCEFVGPDPHGKKILIFGDSHAQMWRPRLEYLSHAPEGAGIRSMTLASNGGCPSVPRVENFPRSCARFNDLTYDLAMNGGYDHVVIISLWHYFSGEVNICFNRDGTCDYRNPVGIFEASFPLFRERVRSIAARGVKVTVYMPFLHSAYDVPAELAKRHFLGRDPGPIESLSRLDQMKGHEFVYPLLRDLATIEGVSVVDPMDQLCQGDVCRLIDDTGAPILRDSNHFRGSLIAGSSLLEKSFKASGTP